MRNEKERIIIYRKILFVIYLLLITLFCYMCLESGEDSSNQSSFVTDAICTLFNISPTNEIESFVRKAIGHFGFFLLFGLVSNLLYMTYYKWKYQKQLLIHFGTGILFIISTEFIFQAIAINRGPSFIDCLIDFGGFLTMTIVVMFIYHVTIFFKVKDLENNTKFMLIFRIITGIIFLGLVITYAVLSLQSGKESNKVGTSIGQTVVNVTPGVSGTVTQKSGSVQIFIRKAIGHYGYFTLIGISSFLFMLSLSNKFNKKILILFQVSFGVIFAFLTEFLLENIAQNRTPNVNDFITNSLGYISICLFLYLVVYFSHIISKPKKFRFLKD